VEGLAESESGTHKRVGPGVGAEDELVEPRCGVTQVVDVLRLERALETDVERAQARQVADRVDERLPAVGPDADEELLDRVVDAAAGKGFSLGLRARVMWGQDR